MPIYEYLCVCGRCQEHFTATWRDAPGLVACPCGREAARIVSLPSFRMAGETNWKGATMKDVWGDSPLGEMEDGINPLRYKSEKPFVDMGKSPDG